MSKQKSDSSAEYREMIPQLEETLGVIVTGIMPGFQVVPIDDRDENGVVMIDQVTRIPTWLARKILKLAAK